MAKTKRMIQEHLALVDIVIELLDARIPLSSKNPDIDKLTGDKKRIVILNKADLAETAATRAWEQYFAAAGLPTLAADARQKSFTAKLAKTARALTKERTERQRKRGRLHIPIRAMVVGIPNVGKSTFINQLAGRASAPAADRPGVTRGRQWIKINGDLDILDTPGVLWPKFEDENVGVKLAATGALSDEITDRVNLCERLLAMLSTTDPAACALRYKLTCHEGKQPRELLEMIGSARGFKMKGGAVDIERAAIVVLDEFRGGKLGRISLEHPPPPGALSPQVPLQN
jgi:ribosome biogenesis GTPase A